MLTATGAQSKFWLETIASQTEVNPEDSLVQGCVIIDTSLQEMIDDAEIYFGDF